MVEHMHYLPQACKKTELILVVAYFIKISFTFTHKSYFKSLFLVKTKN